MRRTGHGRQHLRVRNGGLETWEKGVGVQDLVDLTRRRVVVRPPREPSVTGLGIALPVGMGVTGPVAGGTALRDEETAVGPVLARHAHTAEGGDTLRRPTHSTARRLPSGPGPSRQLVLAGPCLYHPCRPSSTHGGPGSEPVGVGQVERGVVDLLPLSSYGDARE